MKNINLIMKELHSFLILWSTQSLSLLGSSMTNFALVMWTYQEKGSALTTALFIRLFLRALYRDEYLRRCTERQME